MKKISKILSILLVISMILPGTVQTVKANETLKVERVSGSAGTGRVETAIEISKKAYGNGEVDTVILAGYSGEADALTGTLLAKTKNAPMLLTYQNKLDPGLLDEITRLGAKDIYILGGDAVISTEVEDKLKSKEFNVKRLKGEDRIETAVAIAEEVFQSNNPKEAFIIERNSLVDALSIGSIAAKKNAPIFMTNKDSIPAQTLAVLKAMNIEKVTIIGGENTVSKLGKINLEESIKDVHRIGGTTRIETALNVNKEFIDNPSEIIISNGYIFADALVSGYFAALKNAPILLSGDKEISQGVLDFIKESNVKTYVLGGEVALNSTVFETIENALKGIVKPNPVEPVVPTPTPTPTPNPVKNLIIGKVNVGDFELINTDTYGGITLTTIEGNLHLTNSNNPNIILKNMDIKGELVVDIGEGHLELEDVNADKITIKNIGPNSLYIKGNSSIGLLIIKDTNGNANIVLEGNGKVTDTTVNSGAILRGAKGNNYQNLFGNISISAESSDSEIILDGTFNNITIEKDAKVTVSKDAKITNQIQIKSSLDLTVEEGAVVNKVDIETKNTEDMITLKGNINVNVKTSVNLDVQSGTVSISPSNEDLKVVVTTTTGSTVQVPTGNDKIEVSGEGKKEEIIEKEAIITDISFEGAFVNNNLEDNKYALYQVPAAIKAEELLTSISCSKGSSAYITDYLGAKKLDTDYITESDKVVITSQDKKTINQYTINFEINYEYNFENHMQIHSNLIDTNETENMFSSEVIFSLSGEKQNIDGFYVTISAEYLKLNKYDNKKYKSDEIIYQKYIINNHTGEYTLEINDLELKGYKNLLLYITPMVNHTRVNYDQKKIYDGPKDETEISLEGLEIYEFKDTNDAIKGKIDGIIKFDKPVDESKIAYYEVMITRRYHDNPFKQSFSDVIGYLEVGDDKDGVYIIDYVKDVNVGRTEEIDIEIEVYNTYGERDFEQNITKRIKDGPLEGKIEMKTPKIVLNSYEGNTIYATEYLEGSSLKLYKYDSGLNKYIGVETGEQNWSNAFQNLKPGKYKVLQIEGDEQSALSNAVVIRPDRLFGVVHEIDLSKKLTLMNASLNSIIKVYDKNNKLINEVVNENQEKLVIDISNFEIENYYITQSVNEIESSKFVLALGENYTATEIKDSIISSLSKSNMNVKLVGDNIVLSKKENGSVGFVDIDAGAKVKFLVDGKLYEKLRENGWDSQFHDISSISYVEDKEFEDAFSTLNNSTLGFRYADEYYEFNLVVE